MKRLITLLFLFGLIINSYGQKISALPAGSSIASGDLFVLVQSGTTKQLQYLYLGNVLNDTADVLRAEFPPLWRSDISDTADVLRVEISNASTIDTAWARSSGYVILKFINDSVGVGTTTPTSKFEVNGEMKALRIDLDNGYDNILIGDDAGAVLQAGAVQNIFVGNSSAAAATTPTDNVGIGINSLNALTSGTNNVSIGSGESYFLTTGVENTTINSGANPLTTGGRNLFAGYLAGRTCATSSSFNVFLGYKAGYDADVNNCVFIGPSAGYKYDQQGGVGIGQSALQYATTSVGAVAIGYQAAQNLVTSDYHSAFGYQALNAIQTNDGSSVFGYQSGKVATGAQGLSAFGYMSAAALATGDANSYFGYGSGTVSVDGELNSFFGYATGFVVEAGSKNSFFGSSAGLEVVSGDENTMIGARSGASSGDVTGVTYLGYGSGFSNTASNVLFIDNSTTATPLIWGDFTADSIIINGDLRATGYSGGANAWTNESDRRLKENIEPIDNALAKVLALEGVEFDWKDQRRGRSIGFIAQDVAGVVPEVVDAGDPYAMQTSQLTAVLVEAIKEQQTQIDSLKKRNRTVLIITIIIFALLAVRYYFTSTKNLKPE